MLLLKLPALELTAARRRAGGQETRGGGSSTPGEIVAPAGCNRGTPRRPISMPTTSRPSYRAILVLGALLGSSPALAQEEVGKRERQKIAIEWAKAETKNYAFEYENVIPNSTVLQIGNELERALEQYVLVFKYKPEKKLKVKFLDS